MFLFNKSNERSPRLWQDSHKTLAESGKSMADSIKTLADSIKTLADSIKTLADSIKTLAESGRVWQVSSQTLSIIVYPDSDIGEVGVEYYIS